EIGSMGLSGTMAELALISQALRVHGDVELDTSQNGYLNVIAGRAPVNFDRLRGGFGQDGSGQLAWALPVSNGAPEDGIVVDIGANAAMNAGRIGIAVTSQGAGVRIAGDHMAGSGGFRVNSSGALTINGSQITSEGPVSLAASSIDFRSVGDRAPHVSAASAGVTLEARAGDVQLGAAGLSGRNVSPDTLSSLGGVTVLAEGDINATEYAGDSGAVLVSQSALDEGPGRNSNVVLTAGGSVVLNSVSLQATDDISISAGDRIAISNSTLKADGDFRGLAEGDVRLVAVRAEAKSNLRFVGGNLQFGTLDSGEARTTVKAVDGGLVLVARNGGITNFGSLLQGHRAAAGDVQSVGGATLVSTGDILNRSLSVDRLGVVFGEDDDLSISAGGHLDNETGRLFSNAAISLDVAGRLKNETLIAGGTGLETVSFGRGARFASSLFLKRSRTVTMTGDFGSVVIPGEQAFIFAIGDLNIDAGAFDNLGGDVSGKNVAITARKDIHVQARPVGQYRFHQSCKWTCRVSGSSTLNWLGGTITATGALHLTAGTEFVNDGASLLSREALHVEAPLSRFVARTTFGLVERPSGLAGGFRGRHGYVFSEARYGRMEAAAGQILFDGDVVLGDAELLAGFGVLITGAELSTDFSAIQSAIVRRPSGLAWSLLD
ncbi:MAG: hypothetical protein AAGG72_09475, partial [Pseudomonadota bacterium]